MTNRIDDAADALAAALEPVLPGRVWQFLTLEAPGITIGVPTIQPAGTAAIEAEFPVTVRYDGDERAQVAGLNDLVAKVWDACEALPRCSPFDARPVDPGAGGAVRLVVVRVRMHIASRTLCPPVVVQSYVPPEPVPV